MAGLLIHKAAQVVGADIEAAITPVNTVNFEKCLNFSKALRLPHYYVERSL